MDKSFREKSLTEKTMGFCFRYFCQTADIFSYRYGFEDERQACHLVVGDVEADELLPDGGDHVGEAS